MDYLPSLDSDRFALRRVVFGRHPILPISKEFAKDLHTAMDVGYEAVDFEEKLDVVIGNFRSLEEELLRITLQDIFHRKGDFEDFRSDRSEINRQVINILSACKLYKETLVGNVRAITRPDRSALTQISAFFDAQEASSFSWRLMVALRNHAQHAALPITGITYKGKWLAKGGGELTPDGPSQRRQGISLYVNVEELKKNRGFSAGVLAELAAMSARPDIKFVIRDYIDLLAELHTQMRLAIDPHVSVAQGRIFGALHAYNAVDEYKSDAGVAVVRVVSEREFEEVSYIGRDHFDYRGALKEKNRLIGKFAKAYVSSEVLEG